MTKKKLNAVIAMFNIGSFGFPSTFDIRISSFRPQAAYNLALGAEFLYGQACISPFARKDRDLFSLP
jgi:hypothetical protein